MTPTNSITRITRALFAGALLAVAATQAMAAWPDKPIRIMVPWPPGGATDQIGRMLSITEALLGQLYLVTVVALLVANIGRTRQSGPKDGSEGEAPHTSSADDSG